jgi:hypothetical protein
MPEPRPRYPLSRYAARFSIVAPMAAFLMSCLARGTILRSADNTLGWLNVGIGVTASLLILGGLVLGAVGYVGGRKLESSETQILALLGVSLNVGAILLTAWVAWIVLTQPGAR